mgnify:CR=1 FL=1|tara:strand:- start:521 stop:793 length:273 start_codon:yes stop_codon:yes gene_type:complete
MDFDSKKELLVNDDWDFDNTIEEETTLKKNTYPNNELWYSLLFKISNAFDTNGIPTELGDYEDIRKRTIIDNLLCLNNTLKQLDNCEYQE